MISSVAEPIAAVATAGILASFFCDQKNATTLVSLIAAVAGVAYSIFSNSILGTIGFILLGVSTLIFQLLNNRELEKIETELATGAEENAVKMKDVNTQLTEQLDQLNQSHTLMQQQLTALQSDNENRHQIQIQLEASGVLLKEQVNALTQTKQTLENNLASMKESSLAIQEQVQNLLKQNLQIGTQVGAYDQSVGKLIQHRDALKSEIATFQQGFDGDLENLSKQIKLAADTSKALISSVSEKANSIESQFQDELEHTAQLQQALEQSGKAIKDERIKIDSALELLSQKQSDMTKREDEIHKEETDVKSRVLEMRTEVSALTKVLESIIAETEQMEKNKQGLEEVTIGKLAHLAKINQSIEKKQGELIKKNPA